MRECACPIHALHVPVLFTRSLFTRYSRDSPFLLEHRLAALGGKSERAEDWHSNVVLDGQLITG